MFKREYYSDVQHLKLRKQKYTTPKKGTKRRGIINMLLRPQGVTRRELELRQLDSAKKAQWAWLTDDCGFIVEPTGEKRQQTYAVYKITGRLRADGSVRSFG